MNLLFSLNEAYIPPLKVLLYSIFQQHPDKTCAVYLMHTEISEEALEELRLFIEKQGHVFHPIQCTDVLPAESDPKISFHFSIEMYYWLFAPFLLPEELDRILYLDPDIVCLNPFDDFYEQSFDDQLFVASSHQYLTKWLKPINKLRLNVEEAEAYFNSGVVLMNLEAIRQQSSLPEIIETIENRNLLMWLPDQDVFNRLYAGKIKEVDWRRYNLGTRIFEQLRFFFPDKYNKQWAEKQVVFIHYYGKKKPWKDREEYDYLLGEYYYLNESELNRFEQTVQNNRKRDDV